MTNILDNLYYLAQQKHPFDANRNCGDVVEQIKQAKQTLKTRFPECKHDLFLLTDGMDTISGYCALHAFTLGLDLGLSITWELSPLQQPPSPASSAGA